MSRLNEMILEFRENIGQSIEGLALLMQMDPDEYSKLEKDWIPSDEILQRLCSLFEWNYKEIKRIADNTPSKNLKETTSKDQKYLTIENTSDGKYVYPFAKMIREGRIAAKQDERGIATLIGISVDYYIEIEDGLLPPNDLIKKLCSLYGWNYKQIQQKINAQSTVQFGNREPLLEAKEIHSRLPKSEILEIKDVLPQNPLNEQIKQARIDADQNVEGISLLLQINPEFYEQIESGSVYPDPDLLKRISTLFGWNYHEMLIREKSSHYGQLLPAVTKLDSKDKSMTEIKFKKIQKEIGENWTNISQEHQETLLTQLEFLLGSMENLNQNE